MNLMTEVSTVQNLRIKAVQYLALLRLTHWSKAIFVMIGVFYSASFEYLLPALQASLAFCLIASAVYIYNDIEDRDHDSLHPLKKNRPLASDAVTVYEALVLLAVLLLSGLILGWLVSPKLLFILTLYLMINVAYNHLLKAIPILDVMCIALGFMLRVLAGTVGIGLPISKWLTITATLLSLYIAIAKRYMELQLALKNSTRAVLKKYQPVSLQRGMLLSGSAALASYMGYIFYAHTYSYGFMLTLPFAGVALARFYWLTQQKSHSDDPVNVFVADRLSRINLYCFIILSFMALTA